LKVLLRASPVVPLQLTSFLIMVVCLLPTKVRLSKLKRLASLKQLKVRRVQLVLLLELRLLVNLELKLKVSVIRQKQIPLPIKRHKRLSALKVQAVMQWRTCRQTWLSVLKFKDLSPLLLRLQALIGSPLTLLQGLAVVV
jgi:hypothetical protein